MDWLTPETIIQGGGVLMAIIEAGIIYRLVTNHQRSLTTLVTSHQKALKELTEDSNDVIERNTASRVDETKILQRHSDILEKLTDALLRKL